MSFTIGTILNYEYNAAHADHIHVEGPNKYRGIPPLSNPGMTRGVEAIYDALEEEFGPGEYFLDASGRYVGNDPGVYWTHMGGYNRRYIGGTNTWPQHAWWNALDIGPYILGDQNRCYDFLTGVTERDDAEMPQFNEKQAKQLRMFLNILDEQGSDPSFVKWLIPDIREGIITVKELDEALADANAATTVDQFARDLAKRAHDKLARMKAAI